MVPLICFFSASVAEASIVVADWFIMIYFLSKLPALLKNE